VQFPSHLRYELELQAGEAERGLADEVPLGQGFMMTLLEQGAAHVTSGMLKVGKAGVGTQED
jgi:hypothetical protein